MDPIAIIDAMATALVPIFGSGKVHKDPQQESNKPEHFPCVYLELDRTVPEKAIDGTVVTPTHEITVAILAQAQSKTWATYKPEIKALVDSTVAALATVEPHRPKLKEIGWNEQMAGSMKATAALLSYEVTETN